MTIGIDSKSVSLSRVQLRVLCRCSEKHSTSCHLFFFNVYMLPCRPVTYDIITYSLSWVWIGTQPHVDVQWLSHIYVKYMCGGAVTIASSRGLWRDLFDALASTFFRICRVVIDTNEAKFGWA